MRDRQTDRSVLPVFESADDATSVDVKTRRNGKHPGGVEARDDAARVGRMHAGQRRMGRWDPPPGLFPS